MATRAKSVQREEIRVSIPPVILDSFVKEARVVIKWRPDGIWPIDPGLLLNEEFVKRLAADKQFNKNFEIVVMPR